MDSPRANIHSFIIKIWLEETKEETGRAKWRGHITHVPGGERRYLQSLDDILAFVGPYLEQMGVTLGLVAKLRLWWRRWLRHRYWPSSR